MLRGQFRSHTCFGRYADNPGREEECLLNLAKLRNREPEAPDVQLEFRALQAERLVEREAAKERYGSEDVNFRVSALEYKRLLTTKPLLHRLMLGAGAQALQQWTGINGELKACLLARPKADALSYHLLVCLTLKFYSLRRMLTHFLALLPSL
jgi:hypothetical protein